MKEYFFDPQKSVNPLSEIGGKAQNLLVLQNLGMSVPKWFCLPANQYLNFVKQIETDILKILESLNPEDLHSIKTASENIKNLFKTIKIDEELEHLLLAQTDKDKYYAVRSSAVGEDSEESSFAGQLESYLYVSAKNLAKKIKDCWGSSFSVQNIQYLMQKNWKLGEQPVAVIIQEMVNAEKSGVLFTANPLLTENFLDQMVINAGFGLGEGVVTDQVETDTYIFSKSLRKVLDSKHQEKFKQVVFDIDNEGTKLSDIPVSKQNISVLTHNEVANLVSQAKLMREAYPYELDIEWCINSKGRLYITQARAITTLAKGVDRLDFLFDNSNVVESFPGVNTPWTLGQVRDIYSITFKKACLRVGIPKSLIQLNHFTFQNLIGMYKGRMYYNLTNWYQMMRLIPSIPQTKAYIKTWEEMLGISENLHSHDLQKKWFSNLNDYWTLSKVLFRLSYLFVTLDRHLKKLDKNLNNLFQNYWREEKKGVHLEYTPSQSVDRLEAFKAQIFIDTDLTLINDIYAIIFTGLCKNKLKKHFGEQADKIFNDLLLGVRGMESIRPLESLIALADLAKNNDKLLSFLKLCLKTKKFDYNALKLFSCSKEFDEKFILYIEEYGDRGTDELKLETLTFREDPINLIRLIVDYTKLDTTTFFSDQKSRLQAEILVHEKLAQHQFQKILFFFYLKMAKRSINYRENFRLHRSRAYGVVRRMTNNLGKKMAALGDIKHFRDIYFLEKADVYNFYSGQLFDYGLTNKVILNKKRFAEYWKMDVGGKFHVRRGKFYEIILDKLSEGETLVGTPCSAGEVQAEVLVIKSLDEISYKAENVAGKILVATMTDPGWVFLMAAAKGLIVEKGSILSHTAIIGRELGIPTIVGVKNITQLVESGEIIHMNAASGEIKILKEEKTNES